MRPRETKARKLAKEISTYIFEQEYDELKDMSRVDVAKLREAISVLIKVPNKK